jgi:hypothetical protein
MRISLVSSLLIVVATLLSASSAWGQQKYLANCSGEQALPANMSARRLLAEVTINPPSIPGNAANLVFRGLGGSTFPAGSTATIYMNGSVGQSGVAAVTIPFAPDSSWLASTDVSAQALTWLRENKWYLHVSTPDFPNGEVRGQFHLANGSYNDYDGDGRTDVQVYRNSNNTFYALKSANGAFVEQQLGQPGDSVSLTVDFDGDGRSDFSTARYNAEVLWRVLLSTTNVLQETRWGSSTLGDFFAAADYDGDTKMDIAVFRAGVWHILQSSNGTYRQEYWGTSGDIPAAADFDKDGTADLTIARSESGQRVWYTRLSTTGAMTVTAWGLSSDAFFTGRTDFDGDGAADILVIRSVTGQRVFYIRRSSDGALQVTPWGLTSDVVKLGDYDGDGKTDPTVTRAVDGQRIFYILQSSNGQVRYETFGLAGDF